MRPTASERCDSPRQQGPADDDRQPIPGGAQPVGHRGVAAVHADDRAGDDARIEERDHEIADHVKAENCQVEADGLAAAARRLLDVDRVNQGKGKGSQDRQGTNA